MENSQGRYVDVAAAVIVNARGEIFAARRGPGKHLAGFWEFPGGKVEAAESPAEALRRELFEEFGVLCRILDYFAESSHSYEGLRIRLIAYLACLQEGVFVPVDHDAVCWLPPRRLSELAWAPADVQLVAMAVRKGPRLLDQVAPYFPL